MRRQLRFGVGGAAVLLAVAYLIWAGMSETTAYHYHLTDDAHAAARAP
jgi:hypothetical protein